MAPERFGAQPDLAFVGLGLRDDGRPYRAAKTTTLGEAHLRANALKASGCEPRNTGRRKHALLCATPLGQPASQCAPSSARTAGKKREGHAADLPALRLGPVAHANFGLSVESR